MFPQTDDRFWKTVIDTMQEGLMLVDPQGKILFVNQAFERLLGYSGDEVLGQSCELFQCDRCFTARADGLDRYCLLFKENRIRSSECTFRKKDGSSVHLLKTAAVIKNEAGEVTGGVETLTDLTRAVTGERLIADLRQQLQRTTGFEAIIGESPAMAKIKDLTASAAASEAPVILYGESGTGKELFATALHQSSNRNAQPFVKVNCAALNENLLESELFGHIKGAFTGADSKRIGRFEAAHGGSIFLDEIGDLPMTTQTKILRVLQEKEIERVGDHRPVKIDVRIIAATHKDLKQLISNGHFREDLFYRIGVIPIPLPPLRERLSDIPLLTEVFIRKVRQKSHKKIKGIAAPALDLFMHHSWPGNVRELFNAIEYAFVLCPGPVIEVEHLPETIRSTTPQLAATTGPAFPLEADERHLRIARALQESRGSRTRAAAILGVSRVTLWKWLKKSAQKT